MEEKIIEESVNGEQIYSILPQELLGDVLRLKNKGYRLVAISCTYKDGIELTYSFDKEFDFLHLRLNIDSGVEVESITSIYPYAFLYENEIKELFGVKISGISLDYKDNFYKIAKKAPFSMKKEDE
ncbi:NADH-quinone oxidoreductase subunit C [Clostridium sp.]|jgi:ech hydrogenase subunit D|uniref:NADH-quinone oxidoreductase subunit C n=1 Tax=Clostridium sp. TaxID=1506 RepID=UPI0039F5FCC3